MEEKMESKIASLVEYIISKPNEAITLDDYTILSSEIKDARFRREQGAKDDRVGQLISALFSGFGSAAAPDTKPVKPVAKAGKT